MKTAVADRGPERFAKALILIHERFGFYAIGAESPVPYDLPASIEIEGVGTVWIERLLSEEEESEVRPWMLKHLDSGSFGARYLYRASAD